MKHTAQHLMLYLLIPILILLSACSISNTPTPSGSKTPAPSGCNSPQTTRNTIAASALPAVQGDWPTFHGDLSRTGAASMGKGSYLSQAWSFCTGAPVFSSPVVQNGMVYIASTNGTISALNGQSGKLAWQVQAEDAFYSTPALQNDMLYAASQHGTIFALNAKDGFVRWRTKLDTPDVYIWSSPAIANGLLIVGAASALSEHPKIAGQVLAFDLSTGQQRWRTYTQDDGQPGAGVWSSPAIDIAQHVVYVGTGDPDDGVQAFDLSTGKQLWHWRSVQQDINDTDIGAGPTLYANTKGQLCVVVGSKNGSIYSLDAKTGALLWQTHIADHVFSSPTFANGTLYVVGILARRAVSMALDAQTGAPRWQQAIPMIVYASPAIVGQTLYVTVGDGFGPGEGGIETINVTTGELIQFVNIHSTATSSPAVLASWLFVGAHDGNLYAFVR